MTIPRTPRSINSILSPDVAAELYLHAVGGLLNASKIHASDPWSDTGARVLAYYLDVANRHGVTLDDAADITEVPASQLAAVIAAWPEVRQ